MRQIGIFGGTFDPIHNVHLDIARAARDAQALDQVWFVLSARPPHKHGTACVGVEDRYAMVAAALAGEPGMAPSRVEIDRDGPSYTVDTLEAVQQQSPDAKLFLILGMDSLVDLPNWYQPEGILARARLLAVPRPGSWTIPPLVEGHFDLVPFNEHRLSSTELRKRLDADEPADGFIPEGALRIINEKGLYGGG